MARQYFVDTFITNNYQIVPESAAASYRNESSFQNAYANISKIGLSPKVLCIIEGKFSQDNAESVNGRFYPIFWKAQLEKQQTQFLLRKGLMYMMFGHVERGIEDKDVEKGLICGIVTHLQLLDQPTEINGRYYDAGDLFGRAIIISMGGANAGESVYSLLSVGSELSISSRGLGEYIIGKYHTTSDGRKIPIMNPETYELETFDLTRIPGIPDAEVHMVRDNANAQTSHFNQVKDALKQETEDDEILSTFESLEVSDKVAKHINESVSTLIFNINKKENNMAKVNGEKVTKVLEDANSTITSLRVKLEAAEQERDAALEKVKELEKKPEETPEKTESVAAGVEPAEPVENPSEVKSEVEQTAQTDAPQVDMANLGEFTSAEQVSAELDKFKKIANTPEELEAELVKVQESLNRSLEDAEELAKCKEELKKVKEELEEKTAENKEAEQVIESYLKFGTIEQLSNMTESYKKLRAESREQKIIAFANHYSNKKGLTLESVKNIIDSSKSIKDAKRTLESLPNKDVNKGLWKGESIINGKKAMTAPKATFAESMIKSMENRRNRTYTV